MSGSQLTATRQIIESFISNYIRPSMTDVMKVALASEFIVEKASFGDPASNVANAWSALVDGKTWCNGYCYAMKMICDYMDVPCVVIDADGANRSSIHICNAVCIDGNWYLLYLLTLDTHGFFPELFLSSADTFTQITGMTWNQSRYPICNYDYFDGTWWNIGNALLAWLPEEAIL